MAPIQLQAMQTVTLAHFTPFTLFEDFIAQTVFTLCFAFIIWFLVEAPFATLSKELLKMISGGGKKKPKEPRASFKKVLDEDDKRAPEQTSITIVSSSDPTTTADQP